MIEEESQPSRWSGRDRPLSWQAARTLYNVFEAMGLVGAAAHRAAEGIERALRHEGVGAARGLRFRLACIEWSPLVSGHRRFWRLPLAERRARLERWADAGGVRGRWLTDLHRRVDAARRAESEAARTRPPRSAAAAPADPDPQSSEGA